MRTDVLRGQLASPSSAPADGEQVTTFVHRRGLSIEQVLSGRLRGPADFVQRHDEWVLVLEGQAQLVIDGDAVGLAAGEWLLLPAGCPHTLTETLPGTSWLTVHLPENG